MDVGFDFAGSAGHSEIFEQFRSIATTVASTAAKSFSLGPELGIHYGRHYDNRVDLSRHSERILESHSLDEHLLDCFYAAPEAMTRLAIELARHESKANALQQRSLVIVFYLADGVFDEFAVNRLGFDRSGRCKISSSESGCDHQSNVKCRLRFRCCPNHWFPCSWCHALFHTSPLIPVIASLTELSSTSLPSYDSLPTASLQSQQCTRCESVVEMDGTFRDECLVCGARFALYSCGKCLILSNDAMEHCDSCNHCFSQSYFSFHRHVCATSHHIPLE